MAVCRAEPPRHTDAVFVRQGIVVTAGESPVSVFDEQGEVATRTMRLGHNRHWLQFEWQPEASYRLEWKTANGAVTLRRRAPDRPAPCRVRRLELESLTQVDDLGGGIDSVVRFSPDGRLLAVGSFHGWLRIFSVPAGRLLYQQRIAEGIVKRLAWSPDGRTLYVGEQSPDARLFALRIGQRGGPTRELAVRELWSHRLADDLGTSRRVAGDRFSLYWLPAVADLKLSDDGRLFLAGRHSWPVDGAMQNRSRVYAFSPQGKPLWRFPKAAPLELTISDIAIDRAGSRLVFHPSRTQQHGSVPPIEPGALQLLDARSGEHLAEAPIAPLRPHFERAESWDSLAVAPDGKYVAVGLSDGRVLQYAIEQNGTGTVLRLAHRFELATPLVVGRLPLVAGASGTRIAGERLLMQTQNTHVPFGSPLAAQQAPVAHPGANTLTVADLQGHRLWRYRGPFALGGIWFDRAGSGRMPRWLVVGCREKSGVPSEETPYGFLLLDIQRPGGGSRKLVYYYATEGPVAFDADISADGKWIAVVETPARTSDGRYSHGGYRVHLVH